VFSSEMFWVHRPGTAVLKAVVAITYLKHTNKRSRHTSAYVKCTSGMGHCSTISNVGDDKVIPGTHQAPRHDDGKALGTRITRRDV
jgi:hypothetical protein